MTEHNHAQLIILTSRLADHVEEEPTPLNLEIWLEAMSAICKMLQDKSIS